MREKIKLTGLWAVAILARYSGIDLLVRYLLSPSVSILTFHRLGEVVDPLLLTVSWSRFGLLINLILKKSSIVSLANALDLLNGKSKERHTYVLTFDDGYSDNYFLKSYADSGIPITIYIAGQHIDSEILWPFKLSNAILNCCISKLDLSNYGFGVFSLVSIEDRIAAIRYINQLIKKETNHELLNIVNFIVMQCNADSTPITERMMTRQEIEELRDVGITIGAHTWSHAILTRIPFEEAEQEIVQSVSTIRKLIGGTQDIHFAYPNGTVDDFDDRIVTCVEGAGCVSAVTTIYGINRKSTDKYRLRRIPVTQESFLNPFGRFSESRFLSETSGFVAFLKEFMFQGINSFFKKQ